MICLPCVAAPYAALGSLTVLYTYLTDNIQVFLLLLCITILGIYLYKNPDFMDSLVSDE
jgi:hypothetical protein